MKPPKARVYFPGLNALRFFAAFAVLIHHVERVKKDHGLEGIPGFKHELLGATAVTFFFVLSGFLITYLLLVEMDKSGTVSLRKFYARRVLRIWPLYYLIVILGFFVFPHIHFIDNPRLSPTVFEGTPVKLFMFGTLFPNVAHYFFNPMPHILQAWSIGVEEQFYIFWPLITLFFRGKKATMIWVISIMLLLKISFTAYIEFGEPGYYSIRWWRVMNYARFHVMALGGLGAYWLFHSRAFLGRYIYQKWLQWLNLSLIVVLLAFGLEFGHATHEVYAILFLILILNISANPKSILKLEFRWMSYFGKISYGIYMYHLVVVAFAFATLKQFGFMEEEPGFLVNLIMYASSAVLTLIISAFSYEYYEKFFLRLKRSYTVVQSG